MDHQSTDAVIDRLSKDFDTDSVVWEIALREGYAPTSQVETLALQSNSVYRVKDELRGRLLHICLDSLVAPTLARELALAPGQTLVCRDSALTDEIAANLGLDCRLKTV